MRTQEIKIGGAVVVVVVVDDDDDDDDDDYGVFPYQKILRERERDKKGTKLNPYFILSSE